MTLGLCMPQTRVAPKQMDDYSVMTSFNAEPGNVKLNISANVRMLRPILKSFFKQR